MHHESRSDSQQSGRVRAYMACSIDGFIAGLDHDLDWLHRDHSAPGDLPADPEALRFEPFLEQIGAILMGRSTFDAVVRMGVWPYGALPMLVATHRPLATPQTTVRPVCGPIDSLVDEAKRAAQGRDVYLDGGDLVRQALLARRVDELVLTLVPIVLGAGIRLFDPIEAPIGMQIVAHRSFDQGMLQVTMRPR
jgi:dihydrofolate reductase